MDLKKVQCRWHRFPSTTLPRVASYRRQPWAIKSTTPMVLVHVHRFPNKQNHTRNPPKRNQRFTHNLPKRHQPSHVQSAQTKSPIPRATCQNGINRLRVICPNETVGAVPVCPPERPRSGVSIPKIHALCAGNLTMDAPLQGDTGGHTGAAPTNLHQTTRCAITSSHCTFHSPHQPHGVSIPHRIAHSIAPNHTVCHYPIGVILSIAQGWQVQRSLPWVMM